MSEQEKEDKKKSHAHSEQRLDIRQMNVTRKKLSMQKIPEGSKLSSTYLR